ncbi:MAG: hypothetical protein AB7O43_01320 [Hyphomicrobiaceae bacterium]
MQLERDVRLAIAACLIAWLALAGPWLWGNVTIPYDAKAHFLPQLQFLAHALHTGQSPFWNPHVFGGSPQIADPQSLIFSPAFLIAALDSDPGSRMLDGYVLVMIAIGAISIIMFFRERGWHPAGGIVAALSFAFGSSASWRIQHIGQIESLVAFATALWLLQRTLSRRTARSGIVAGLACALLVIQPNQVALLGVYILATYVGIHLLTQPDRLGTLRRSSPALAAAAVTTLALTALPLLMVAEFALATNRPEIPFAEAAKGSLHPASLLTAVVGDLFGAGNSRINYWGPYSESWDPGNLTLSQNMTQLYAGALPALVLLVLGFVRGLAWRREIRFFTFALLVMVLYALGIYTPAFRFFYEFFPGVCLFRRPADATFMIGAMMAIVGGYLVHCLARADVPQPTTAQERVQIGLLALVFAASVVVALHEKALALAGQPLLVAVFSLAAAAAAMWMLKLREISAARVSVPLLALLMAVDLGANNRPNESTALPAKEYDVLRADTGNATIALLKARLKQPPGSPRRDRVELAGVGFEWPNAGMVHGFDHTLGYNPLRLCVVSDALGADDTIAGWDQRRFTPLFPSYRSQLADLMGLRYLVSSVPAEQIDKRLKPGDLKLIAKTADGFVYENPRALPRVMLVHDWLQADFAAMIRTGRWPVFDPKQTVLLQQPPAVRALSGPSIGVRPQATRRSSARSSATLRVYGNTQIDVAVNAARPGFVVLNDVWHPWWRATVDRRPVEILKANVMFRAVAVPAGHSVVRFTFRPLEGALAGIGVGPRQTPPDTGAAVSALPR